MKSVMHSFLKSANKHQRLLGNHSTMLMLGSSNQRFSQRAAFSTHMGQQYEIKKLSSDDIMKLENDYSAHNYHPLKVVFERAQGVVVYDPEGRKYYDFLSAYSAVNQGHCHPKIIETLKSQAEKVTLSSRAFYNNVFGQWAQYVTRLFGFEKVLPMNTGAEAVETALKAARKWGYEVKGIPDNEAIIIACSGNFHGRTIGVISFSDSDETRDGFGPFLPGVLTAKYDDVDSLRELLEKFGKNVAGFLFEPIQGEAGVRVPSDKYLSEVYKLCKEHNVLMICDEIQTGLGRTGKMLCYEHSLDKSKGEKPDILILGKALSGGVFPVSCILADKKVMDVFEPGTHGSTYGGNPLGCSVSMTALEVLQNENMIENAARLGEIFRQECRELVHEGGIVDEVRGKGLLNAFVMNHSRMHGKNSYDLCMRLKENGLLAKQTHDNIIRFAPPLVITEEQLRECIAIIKKVVRDFEKAPQPKQQ
ncbi:hypothetical protein C9374_000598 [Naegleria lovaniensis]|uniref:Ornithine aminotransferase n=1 Tax=Naegleria lovaniensis TaxID=51637 RepID=A0AA88KNV2_NAELO|nr:uncharacterized protein C9374_000598 [Naegleria lovaniensis]KAG2388434.1 hypothetical protein C9374_000598 [Naegleria lovaniensis]